MVGNPTEQQHEDALRRAPVVRDRLASSASGFVLVKRFSARDRSALRRLIDLGEIEIFSSAFGSAYRLTAKGAGP